MLARVAAASTSGGGLAGATGLPPTRGDLVYRKVRAACRGGTGGQLMNGIEEMAWKSGKRSILMRP